MIGITMCTRSECQTSGGCAHRGPRGESCYFPAPFVPAAQGCICPPTSEQTCRNPICPRGGVQMVRITSGAAA